MNNENQRPACVVLCICAVSLTENNSWLNRLFGGLITDLQSPLYLLYFLCFLTSYFFLLEHICAHWMHHTDFTCFHCNILTKSHDDCTLKRFVVETRKLIVHYCQPSLSLILPAFSSANHNFWNQSVQAYVHDSFSWIMRTQISNNSTTIYMLLYGASGNLKLTLKSLTFGRFLDFKQVRIKTAHSFYK